MYQEVCNFNNESIENPSKKDACDELRLEVSIQFDSFQKNKETIPEIIDIRQEELSPSKYPILKELFGDFDSFKVPVIKLKNARWGGEYSNGKIVVGEFKDQKDYDSIFINEAIHATIHKLFPNFSTNINMGLNNFENFKLPSNDLKIETNHQVNEFLSDVGSFQKSPESEFQRINNFTEEGLKVGSRIKFIRKKVALLRLQTDISEMKSLLNKILPQIKKLSDDNPNKKKYTQKLKPYQDKLTVHLKESEDIIKSIKIEKPGYTLSYKFLKYQLKKNPQISPKEVAQKYMELGKLLVPEIEKREEELSQK